MTSSSVTAAIVPGDKCWTYENNKARSVPAARSAIPGSRRTTPIPPFASTGTTPRPTSAGSAARPGRAIASSAKRNGSMRRGPERRADSQFGDNESDLCGYVNGADRTAKEKYKNSVRRCDCRDGFANTAPVGPIPGERLRAARHARQCLGVAGGLLSRQLPGSSQTMAPPGQPGHVSSECFAAAPGISTRATCVRPSAAASGRASGAAIWEFGLPEHSNLLAHTRAALSSNRRRALSR